MQNTNKMTPKDLATANNHTRCVELLANGKRARTQTSAWFAPANAAGHGEGDAVQQQQTQSVSQTSHHATQAWDELESSRSALARALTDDKHRQLLAQQSAMKTYKLEIQRRRDEIRKREEQVKHQQLRPRSSLIRRKKQSTMIKIKGASHAASYTVKTRETLASLGGVGRLKALGVAAVWIGAGIEQEPETRVPATWTGVSRYLSARSRHAVRSRSTSAQTVHTR